MDLWIAYREAVIYGDIGRRHAVITLSSRCHSVSCCCTWNQKSVTDSASKCPFSLHPTWFWNNNTFAGDYGSVLGVMVRLMSLPQLISVLPGTVTCNNVHPCHKSLRVYSCSNCTLYPPPLESCLEAIKFIPSYLLPSGPGMAFSLLLLFWLSELRDQVESFSVLRIYSQDTGGFVRSLFFFASFNVSQWK